MQTKPHKIIIAVFIFFAAANLGHAAISFTDGKWETTFDCAESSQWDTPIYGGCDGAEMWILYGCGDSDQGDLITSAANHSGGGGGRGFRHFQNDGTNDNGGGINFSLSTAAPELWLRFYIRYAAGFSWSSLSYDKLIYPVMAGGSATWVISFGYTNEIVLADETSSISWLRIPDVGFYTLYPGGVSDGSWICLEVYVKTNTATDISNGVGRVWINGVLVGERTDMNFTGGYSAALAGTKDIRIGGNQANPNNGGCTALDFDDVTMYNSTPPSRDAANNPMIGPIGWGTPTLTIPGGVTISGGRVE